MKSWRLVHFLAALALLIKMRRFPQAIPTLMPYIHAGPASKACLLPPPQRPYRLALRLQLPPRWLRWLRHFYNLPDASLTGLSAVCPYLIGRYSVKAYLNLQQKNAYWSRSMLHHVTLPVGTELFSQGRTPFTFAQVFAPVPGHTIQCLHPVPRPYLRRRFAATGQ